MQEIYYNTGEGDKFGLNAWYINSNRELAMLSTDYGNDMDFENRQREQTFRGVLSWDRVREKWKVGVKGGYIHTWMATGGGKPETDSRKPEANSRKPEAGRLPASDYLTSDCLNTFPICFLSLIISI